MTKQYPISGTYRRISYCKYLPYLLIWFIILGTIFVYEVNDNSDDNSSDARSSMTTKEPEVGEELFTAHDTTENSKFFFIPCQVLFITVPSEKDNFKWLSY